MLLAGAMTLVFVLLGVGSWAAEYHAQRTARVRLMVVRPPRWLAWICGNPKGDGSLDLERATRQLSALTFVIAAPLTLLLGLAPHHQAALVFLVYVAVALPGAALVEWTRRHAERERNLLEGTAALRNGGRRRLA